LQSDRPTLSTDPAARGRSRSRASRLRVLRARARRAGPGPTEPPRSVHDGPSDPADRTVANAVVRTAASGRRPPRRSRRRGLGAIRNDLSELRTDRSSASRPTHNHVQRPAARVGCIDAPLSWSDPQTQC